MSFAVGIACAMVVTVLGEVAGTPNKQLLVKEQSKIKDGSSIFLREDLEKDLKDLEMHTKSIKKKKTKLHCKIAGGQCEHKKKECHGGYGWCFEGKDYCTHHAHYCCCVPPPPLGCVFGDKSYPHKSFLTESCFKMQCLDGEWNLTYGAIYKECEHCSAFPISTIQPFEGEPYDLKQDGTFTFTGQESGSIGDYALEVFFGLCAVHNGTYSCVKNITYIEIGLRIEIMPALPGADLVIVNGNNVTMESGTSRTFNGLTGSVWVFKESPLKFYLTACKGLSVRITREASSVDGDDPTTILDVWTRSPTPDIGLCAGLERSIDHPLAGRSLPKSNEVFKKGARLERK